MTRFHRSRRTLVAAVTALCLLLPVGANASVDLSASGAAAYVDPNLMQAVMTNPAPALVAWDGRTDRARVAQYLRASGVEHRIFSELDMAVACAAGAADVRALAATPGAISVWGDEQMRPTVAAAGGRAASASAQTAASVDGTTGMGVGIAVMDTGVDGTHPDLEFGPKTKLNARVLVSHLEVMGPGNDTCFMDSYDDNVRDSETVSGHGTHLAGVAAGDGTASGGDVTGVAPDADIVGLNVVDHATPQATGDISVSLIRFLAGVNYVISRSLDGGPTVTKVALLGWTSEGLYDPWHPHSLAIRDLHDFGVSVVVPVGNGGPQTSNCEAAATCRFNRLAVGDYAIGVGATPTAASTALEDYSSRGDPTPRDARGEMVSYEPTVVAPGTNVLGPRRVGAVTYTGSVPGPYSLAGQGPGAGDDVTNIDYQALTGTSVAAAQVAGTVALMQQAAMDAKGCYLTTDQVRQILQDTATEMAQYQRWEVGAGAVDAAAAVGAARAAPKVWSIDPWMCRNAA